MIAAWLSGRKEYHFVQLSRYSTNSDLDQKNRLLCKTRNCHEDESSRFKLDDDYWENDNWIEIKVHRH